MFARSLIALLCLTVVGGGAWLLFEDGGALAASPVTSAAVDDDDDDDGDEPEEELTLDQLPDGLLEAAEAALPGVEFTAASTEMELGGRVYELQGLGDTGRVEIELNAAGDVLEIEYGEDDD